MPKGTEYELAVKIAGKVDASFKNATKNAKSSLSGLASAAKGAFKGIAVGAAAVATATAAVGAAAVKSAMEYESQLANISTLLTGTEEEVAARTKEIGEQVLEVSNRTGVSTDDLTDGMYQVVSAFGDTADAAAQLEVAAKAAAAGNATTTDSINLLSAVTKGYGDTSAEAVQKAADLSFATVRLGQTSFPELAASMGKVIPLASTLGVEQEQLFGAMATLTGVTGSTSEVVTQLKATMQGFLSPTKEMQAALSSLGYESGQALLESEGLQGALESLKGTVGGDELAFAKLFSSVEAQTAVLAMAGTQADNLTQKTAEMYEATGAADTAFQRQTDTLAYTIQSFKNLGKNMLTQVGTAMLPAVQRIMDAVVEMEPTISTVFTLMSDAIVSMVPVIEELIPPIAEFAQEITSALLPLLSDIIASVLPSITSLIRSLLPVIMQLVTTILPPIIKLVQQLLPPLMQIIDAILPVVSSLISALAPVITSLFNALTPVLNVVTQLITPIANIISKLSPIITLIGTLVSTLIDTLSPAISFIANLIGTVLNVAFEAIGPVIDSVTAVFGGLIDFISNIFAGNWSAAWDSIVSVFGNIFGGIVNIAKVPINAVISAINWVIEKINSVSFDIPDWVPLIGGSHFGLSIPTIPLLASGGIATAATLAMVGEGAEPEAILPLSKLAEMLDGGGGGDTYNNDNDYDQSDSVVFAPVFNFYGQTSPDEAQEAGRISFAEFKRLYDQMMAERRRKNFSMA